MCSGVYGILGREITKYTVMYGVYIRFWLTLTHAACRVCTLVCGYTFAHVRACVRVSLVYV